MDEFFSILMFYEHECLQTCRPEVPWNNLNMCHWYMPPTVSVQGKCRSEHLKNNKGDYNLGGIIFQTQSIFLWNGKL